VNKIALLLVGLALSSCGRNWVEFKPPDGSFAVMMPVKPIMKSAPSGTSWRATDGDMLYMVSTNTVPDQYKDPVQTETLFDNLQMSAMGSDKVPAERKRITLGPEQYPGREILVEKSMGGSGAMKGRAYRAHNRLFFLTVFAPLEKMGNPDVQRFLDSLTILRAG
jgi:hypothetical protein